MKILVYKIIFLLLLAGILYSCAKKGEAAKFFGNIPVEYKPCPCEEGKSMNAVKTDGTDQDLVLKEEAYLFIDRKSVV